MNYLKLQKLRVKPFFTVEDVATLLSEKEGSARVLCSRYMKEGLFIRLKNNFYLLSEAWRNIDQEELFQISNFLQVPSYVSFMTALSYYGITTQVQNNFFESVSLKRTKKINVDGKSFYFYKLNKKLYSGFIKKDNFFIATKEKAFLDMVYLFSFGKYKIDFSSLDIRKLDNKKIKSLLKAYPSKTKKIIERICKI
ncbi:MAG: hypothetical protein WC412_06865 [Candidatus Omnitrophota bacterium]|jgi:predicted transcriptional regulator of viral defense system